MSSLEPFRVFVEIYRTGSVSAAARERNLTQPAISAQLSVLEQRVGEALFIRSPRGMLPTDKGKWLYLQVVEAIDRLENAARLLRSPNTVPMPLRLGCTPEFLQGYVLPRIGRHSLALSVSFGSTRDLLDLVEEGKLDAALLPVTPTNKALTEYPLTDMPFVLIGPTQWANDVANALPNSDWPASALASWLNARAWVSYSLELPLTRRFFTQVLCSKLSAKQNLVVPDLRAVVKAVEVGLGFSLVPLFAAQEALAAKTVSEIWPVSEQLPKQAWRLVCRSTNTERQDLQSLIQVLKTGN